MDTAENIVATALLTGDHETGARQMTCNLAARMQCTCDCGQVLDQRTCFVLESIQDGKEKTLAVCCKDCAKANAVKLATLAKLDAKHGIAYRWQHWTGTITIEPMIYMEIVHIGEPQKPTKHTKPTKPTKQRIPSVKQLLTGKEQSGSLRPFATKVLDITGLLCHQGILIIRIKEGAVTIVTTDNERRKAKTVSTTFSKFTIRKDSSDLVPGEKVKIGEFDCVRMISRETGKHICTVQDIFRRSAEKHGGVYRWFPSMEIGDHETGSPMAVIGRNTAGERVAVVACIIDE